MMNIKELREKYEMDRPEFARYFNLPYRTVQNWELGIRKCPDIILELMEYKLENENKKKGM